MEIPGLLNNTTENLKQKKIIKTDKTTRLDGLSAKNLKLSAQVISKPLTAILNLSIQSSSCSNDLIKAKVTPIFKKGSKADVFDLVNHKLLLQNLAAYMFSSNTQL